MGQNNFVMFGYNSDNLSVFFLLNVTGKLNYVIPKGNIPYH